jgi:hypothetical protein
MWRKSDMYPRTHQRECEEEKSRYVLIFLNIAHSLFLFSSINCFYFLSFHYFYDMKGKADLSVVSRLAALFKGIIPIISNGNIITRDDVQTAANEGTLLVQFFLFFFFLFFCFTLFLFLSFLFAILSFCTIYVTILVLKLRFYFLSYFSVSCLWSDVRRRHTR